MSDCEIVESYLSGKNDAFATIVERHGDMAYAVCHRVLGNDADARDAFQATFIIVAQKLSTLRERHCLGGWIYRIAYRAACEMRRQQKRRRLRESESGEWAVAENPVSESTATLHDALIAELATLPTKYRSLLIWCYLEKKSYVEMANLAGITPDAVRGRLARARELLRRRLQHQEPTLATSVIGSLLVGALSSRPASALAASTVEISTAMGDNGVLMHAIRPEVMGVVKSMSAPIGAIAKLSMAVAAVIALGLAVVIQREGNNVQQDSNISSSSVPAHVEPPVAPLSTSEGNGLGFVDSSGRTISDNEVPDDLRVAVRQLPMEEVVAPGKPFSLILARVLLPPELADDTYSSELTARGWHGGMHYLSRGSSRSVTGATNAICIRRRDFSSDCTLIVRKKGYRTVRLPVPASEAIGKVVWMGELKLEKEQSDGAPVKGMVVLEDGTPLLASGNVSLRVNGSSNRDVVALRGGQFQFDHVPPGDYLIEFWCGGYAVRTWWVTVPDDRVPVQKRLIAFRRRVLDLRCHTASGSTDVSIECGLPYEEAYVDRFPMTRLEIAQKGEAIALYSADYKVAVVHRPFVDFKTAMTDVRSLLPGAWHSWAGRLREGDLIVLVDEPSTSPRHRTQTLAVDAVAVGIAEVRMTTDSRVTADTALTRGRIAIEGELVHENGAPFTHDGRVTLSMNGSLQWNRKSFVRTTPLEFGRFRFDNISALTGRCRVTFALEEYSAPMWSVVIGNDASLIKKRIIAYPRQYMLLRCRSETKAFDYVVEYRSRGTWSNIADFPSTPLRALQLMRAEDGVYHIQSLDRKVTVIRGPYEGEGVTLNALRASQRSIAWRWRGELKDGDVIVLIKEELGRENHVPLTLSQHAKIVETADIIATDVPASRR